ncbi:MAG TPA: hypothetical protein VK688_04075 [Gemmatimonadales bacterium]|nr:hypothetical protein [Gemmatimonadales bacterium]
MREERGIFPDAPGSRERLRGARRDLEHARDQARKAVVRTARAVERAGLDVGWVRRLVKRLTRLREARSADVRRPRTVRHIDP